MQKIITFEIRLLCTLYFRANMYAKIRDCIFQILRNNYNFVTLQTGSQFH
jgi:hypothetical protein